MTTLVDLLNGTCNLAVFDAAEGGVFQAHAQPGHPRVLAIAGSNAAGKSLFFRLLASAANDAKVLPLTVSIRERTGAGTGEMSGMRRMFMFGDESEQSTGATSLSTVSKAFINAQRYAEDEGRRVVVMLDEPEQGLSEDYAAAMGRWLAERAALMTHPGLLGLVVVSHSRPLMRALGDGLGRAPTFVCMDAPRGWGTWLDERPTKTVAELEALERTAQDRRRAVSAWSRERAAAKTPRS